MDLSTATDVAFMRTALRLAQRGLGNVWPNPAVGCILVRDGVVVGRGWTQPGGRPHAETEALRRAAGRARGATAYVSLEPCAHEGATPPCADALVAAGISRAVVALKDPDARVDGRGLDRLRRAGIAVDTPLLADEAQDLNLGFFLRNTERRPLFTLKLASSLDGRIATSTGNSRWITGEAARAVAHGLRASHDAILIGSNTAIADAPSLTCRLPGMARRSPVRIIADGRLRLPTESPLVKTANETATWVLTSPAADRQRCRLLQERGIRIIEVSAGPDGGLSPPAMALALGDLRLTRVLIEGGGRLAAAFLAEQLIDRMVWMRAPMLIGGDGLAAVAGLGVDALGEAPAFECTDVRRLAPDVLANYVRRC